MATFVYERILDLLEAEGIKTLFGIPDPSFFHMFTTAEKRGWRVVAPHHEEAGGFMAEAMWRMTGRPGVVVGNQGPGVANLVPAAICAAKENTPTLFIGGQRRRVAEQRVKRGRIQFIRQSQHFESVMKYVGIIEYPEQTDEVIHEAFRRALTGTPGPVFVEYPMNVIKAQLDLPPALPPEAYRLVHPCASAPAVEAAVALLRNARQPILLIGQGVFAARAHEAIAALARALGCPVIQTSGATSFLKGLEERTFAYGLSPAAVDAVVKSDVVLAIGTELGEPVHHGTGHHWSKGNVDRTWILIESDATAIGVNRPIDVPLVGDLRAVVPQLMAAFKDRPRAPSAELDSWIKQHAAYKAGIVASVPKESAPIHPARSMFEATRAIPQDAVYVRDGGTTSIYSWTYSQSMPSDLLWNQNFGHLGTGLPYAIGAQLAVGPDRRVVLVTSDSAFLFHISELETAVRKNLPVVCIVACDYAWGLEVRGYRAIIGPESPETEAHWGKVRLDKVAEGFGAHGEYVERAEDIGPAVARALASGKAAVVQVPVNARENAALQLPGYDEFKTWYTDFTY